MDPAYPLARTLVTLGGDGTLVALLVLAVLGATSLMTLAFRRTATHDGRPVALRTLLRTQVLSEEEVDWSNPYARPVVRRDGTALPIRVRTRPGWPVLAWLGLCLLGAVGLQGLGVARVSVVAPDGRVVGSRWVGLSDRLETPASGRCRLYPRESGHLALDWRGTKALLDTGMQYSMVPDLRAHTTSYLLPIEKTAHGFGGAPVPLRSFALLQQTSVCGGAPADHLAHRMPDTSAVREPILGMADLLGGAMVLDLQALTLDTSPPWSEVLARHPWVTQTEPIRLAGTNRSDLTFWAEADGQPVLVHLDTGAFPSSVSPEMPGLKPMDPRSPDRTVSVPAPAGLLGGGGGRVEVRTLPEVCTGSLCFEVGAVTLAYSPRHWKAEVNVGMDALYGRVLVVDARRRQLWISAPAERPANARIPYLDELRALIEEAHSGSSTPEEPTGSP